MQFKRNQVVIVLGLSVSLLVGFQNCSPASMKFSKTDLIDQSVDAQAQEEQPQSEAQVEQQVAVIEQQADQQAAEIIAASDAVPCDAPPLVIVPQVIVPPILEVAVIDEPVDVPSIPSAPSEPSPSHGQSGGHQPPHQSPPPVIESTLPPSSPVEVASVPEEEGLNQFTIIKEDAFLLACGKDISSIIAISRGARVVIVNGSLGSLKSLAKDAEVILVNSNIKSSIPALRGHVVNVVDESQKQAWLSQCAETSYASMPASPQPFRINMIRAEDGSILPRAASSYHITQIKTGAVLESLHSLGLFKVTVLGDEVSLKVKTKDFKMTVLSKGSKLILN